MTTNRLSQDLKVVLEYVVMAEKRWQTRSWCKYDALHMSHHFAVVVHTVYIMQETPLCTSWHSKVIETIFRVYSPRHQNKPSPSHNSANTIILFASSLYLLISCLSIFLCDFISSPIFSVVSYLFHHRFRIPAHLPVSMQYFQDYLIQKAKREWNLIFEALCTLKVKLFIGTLWLECSVCTEWWREEKRWRRPCKWESVHPQCEWMHVYLCVHLHAALCFCFPHLSLRSWCPNPLLMFCPTSQRLSYQCNISSHHRLAEDQ